VWWDILYGLCYNLLLFL